MITVNSTILSYNKINQVQEQIPIPSPDSYIFKDIFIFDYNLVCYLFKIHILYI